MVLTRLKQRIGALTWVLIFGGLLMLALGLVVRQTDPGLGWGIASVAIAAVGGGVFLIWLRSRWKEDERP